MSRRIITPLIAVFAALGFPGIAGAAEAITVAVSPSTVYSGEGLQLTVSGTAEEGTMLEDAVVGTAQSCPSDTSGVSFLGLVKKLPETFPVAGESPGTYRDCVYLRKRGETEWALVSTAEAQFTVEPIPTPPPRPSPAPMPSLLEQIMAEEAAQHRAKKKSVRKNRLKLPRELHK